jgi:hypothetical protein
MAQPKGRAALLPLQLSLLCAPQRAAQPYFASSPKPSSDDAVREQSGAAWALTVVFGVFNMSFPNFCFTPTADSLSPVLPSFQNRFFRYSS